MFTGVLFGGEKQRMRASKLVSHRCFFSQPALVPLHPQPALTPLPPSTRSRTPLKHFDPEPVRCHDLAHLAWCPRRPLLFSLQDKRDVCVCACVLWGVAITLQLQHLEACEEARLLIAMWRIFLEILDSTSLILFIFPLSVSLIGISV